jgi:hypothetical protein
VRVVQENPRRVSAAGQGIRISATISDLLERGEFLDHDCSEPPSPGPRLTAYRRRDQ